MRWAEFYSANNTNDDQRFVLYQTHYQKKKKKKKKTECINNIKSWVNHEKQSSEKLAQSV